SHLHMTQDIANQTLEVGGPLGAIRDFFYDIIDAADRVTMLCTFPIRPESFAPWIDFAPLLHGSPIERNEQVDLATIPLFSLFLPAVEHKMYHRIALGCGERREEDLLSKNVHEPLCHSVFQLGDVHFICELRPNCSKFDFDLGTRRLCRRWHLPNQHEQ